MNEVKEPSLNKNSTVKNNKRNNINRKNTGTKVVNKTNVKKVENKTNNKTASKNVQKKTSTGTKTKKQEKKNLKIISLGGLNEIGKNLTVYEYDNDIVIVDCGMAFPDEDTPGIDVRIPDFTYLIENKDKIRGLIVTHGHEDHIGGIAYLLKKINIPIYGSRLTLGLLEGKLEEHNLLYSTKLMVINTQEKISLGKFSLETIHVNHSIPGAIAIAIHTPIGTVIHTGDFKIDTTPIDGVVTDIGRFCELSKKNILALAVDSTNAERPGYSQSEKIVGENLHDLFEDAKNSRVIIATFASNIHRLQQIFDAAKEIGRKVAISGKSMLNNVNIAVKLGYLRVSPETLISIDDINSYQPGQLIIVTTGSQGEPLSALHRIAFGEHRQVQIMKNDVVIISATPIPGNEKLVNKVINELISIGAKVYHGKNKEVHVSGHACQEEIRLLISLVKPKYYIPIHGEQKHLIANAEIAKNVGIDEKNIIIGKIGDVISVDKSEIKIIDKVQAGQVFVDGSGVGDVGNIVLKDRKILSENGIIIVSLTIDGISRDIISGPEITSRGFVYMKESEELFRNMRKTVLRTFKTKKCKDFVTTKTLIKEKLSDFVYNETKRRPMILVMIMEL